MKFEKVLAIVFVFVCFCEGLFIYLFIYLFIGVAVGCGRTVPGERMQRLEF